MMMRILSILLAIVTTLPVLVGQETVSSHAKRLDDAAKMITPITTKTPTQLAERAAGDAEAVRAGLRASADRSASSLAIRDRSLDPFGLPASLPLDNASNPSGDPKLIGSSDVTSEQSERNLAREAVLALNVSGVCVSREEFYCGARVVHIGDSLVLGYKGVKIPVRVIGISQVEIKFEGPSKSDILLQLSIVPSLRPQQLIPVKR